MHLNIKTQGIVLIRATLMSIRQNCWECDYVTYTYVTIIHLIPGSVSVKIRHSMMWRICDVTCTIQTIK